VRRVWEGNLPAQVQMPSLIIHGRRLQHMPVKREPVQALSRLQGGSGATYGNAVAPITAHPPLRDSSSGPSKLHIGFTTAMQP
jgi:hypothetical protein